MDNVNAQLLPLLKKSLIFSGSPPTRGDKKSAMLHHNYPFYIFTLSSYNYSVIILYSFSARIIDSIVLSGVHFSFL